MVDFAHLFTPESLSAFAQVIMIDLVLAGDNAVVIGLAAAGLPLDQRRKAIIVGIIAATVLRIGFAGVAIQLLQIVGLLFAGGIHGADEAEVYRELCVAAEEWVEIIEGDDAPFPPPTAGKSYSGKFVVRISPDLHQRAALKAMARGESLNQFVTEALANA